MSLAFAVFFIFSAAMQADEKLDTPLYDAFAKAWRAKHDAKTDRDQLAVMVYRDAWVRVFAYTGPPTPFDGRPFPEDASAESILRGEHGDIGPWRLYPLTQGLRAELFTERPAAVLKAMAADLQGDAAHFRRATDSLREWKGHLYRISPDRRRDNPLVIVMSEPAKHTWQQIVRELYPVAAKRFQQLDAREEKRLLAGEKEEKELLAEVLRELDDPRAIPLLLGANPRKNFGIVGRLQRGRKADPGLVKLLADVDAEVRRNAAYALRESGDIALAPHAIKLLGDENAGVRAEALQLTHSLLWPERPALDAQLAALAARAKALLQDPDPGVRANCAILLGQRKDFAAAPVLLELLRKGKSQVSQLGLVSAMVSLTGEQFGYDDNWNAWQPTTANNRAALERFAAWIAEHEAHARPSPKK
jgi:hypothetical protein